MRLRIIEVNFTTKYDRISKLVDERGDLFYIMQQSFYEKNNIRSIIAKPQLDYYDVGSWISANYIEIGGLRVLVK